jgi:hypothetical protein
MRARFGGLEEALSLLGRGDYGSLLGEEGARVGGKGEKKDRWTLSKVRAPSRVNIWPH